ncbi:MAG: DegT/DnrJ/EryC1/StrS family aminotransferase [Candidatus Eisenbacteria sp.]|nr:DegT/DnrJ/EryC1/StrS family aminotransferase [Candidatus Eisenbacteria bacterium]
MKKRLAIEGGEPVRRVPLPPPYPGALVMGEEEREALLEVLEHKSPFRYYGPDLLKKVSAFEDCMAEYIGTRHALGTSSATAALKVGLVSLGVGPGDEVIIPAFTFIACVSAVVAARAVPVFAEVDDTLNIDPADVKAKLSPRTKAIMPVHLQGVACDMDALLSVTAENGVAILEDCAQSMGSAYKDRKLGTLGEIGVFSLQMNKLITTGEGGCLVTSDYDLFIRAVRCHDHGNLREFEGGSPFLGENYRMSEFAGALGLVQLAKLESIIARMKAAQREILDGIGGIEGLILRRISEGAEDIGTSVIFFAPSAETARKFVDALNGENIGASQIYGGAVYDAYPQVLAMSTATSDGCPFTCPRYTGKVAYQRGMCPVTESVVEKLIYIPLAPTFDAQDIADVVAGVRKVANCLL